jgi:hypothetical protein
LQCSAAARLSLPKKETCIESVTKLNKNPSRFEANEIGEIGQAVIMPFYEWEDCLSLF